MRILLALIVSLGVAQAAERGNLRAGAARVDITPPVNAKYPPSGKYAHERLYIRAIVLDNGATRAALIGADRPMPRLPPRFVTRFPGEVAGLAFVASSHEEQAWRLQELDPQGPGLDDVTAQLGYYVKPGERLQWRTDLPLIVLGLDPHVVW